MTPIHARSVRPADAIDQLRQLVERHRAAGDDAALSGALHRLGGALLRRGHRDEAEACWMESLDLTQGRSGVQCAALLTDLGWLALSQGRSAEALQALDRALAALEAAGPHDERLWIAALNGKAAAHRARGEPDLAVAALVQAADAAEHIARKDARADDGEQWATILINLGRLYLETNRPARTRDVMTACLEVTVELARAAPTVGHRNMHAAARNQMGRALERMAKLRAAEPYLAESAAEMRALVSGAGRTELADDLARAEADLLRVRQALDQGGGG